MTGHHQPEDSLGWTDGRNVRMDLRWAGGDINRIRQLAHELVGLQPDTRAIRARPKLSTMQSDSRVSSAPIRFGSARVVAEQINVGQETIERSKELLRRMDELLGDRR
jgi:hypothetical protein